MTTASTSATCMDLVRPDIGSVVEDKNFGNNQHWTSFDYETFRLGLCPIQCQVTAAKAKAKPKNKVISAAVGSAPHATTDTLWLSLK